mmetsp:Transcript_72364/g.198212  ORF Transcript_72364/g.198212 Transcript_72364/m.198212 type:complete len:233 (+) Transcript_72364:600-1298(+)
MRFFWAQSSISKIERRLGAVLRAAVRRAAVVPRARARRLVHVVKAAQLRVQLVCSPADRGATATAGARRERRGPTDIHRDGRRRRRRRRRRGLGLGRAKRRRGVRGGRLVHDPTVGQQRGGRGAAERRGGQHVGERIERGGGEVARARVLLVQRAHVRRARALALQQQVVAPVGLRDGDVDGHEVGEHREEADAERPDVSGGRVITRRLGLRAAVRHRPDFGRRVALGARPV